MTDRIQTDERDPELDRPITARHFMPKDESEISVFGTDVRQDFLDYLWGYRVEIDQQPDDTPVVIPFATWVHTDAHGILTRDVFEADLREAVKRLAKSIRANFAPFEPVRLTDKNMAYGVSFYDFRGDPFPFDLRLVGEFRACLPIRSDKGEDGFSPGFRYTLATRVKFHRERDGDVYVGQDFSTVFDEE